MLTPSPYRQIYEPSMQAYFDLRCPLHDCTGGGFALHAPIAAMLADPRKPRRGSACCHGQRPGSAGVRPCALQVDFELTADDVADAALP